MPHYLAFLDAISPWTAPDWVYETAERLPEMSELDPYKIVVEKVRHEDGTPGLAFVGDYGVGVGTVRYRMFKRDEDTGEKASMGVMPTWYIDSYGENGMFIAAQPWLWPALEGQPVASYVNNMVEPGSVNYLGSIPIQIGTEKWFLRYGYFGAEDRYTVYGLWEGYDTDSSQFNRNVKSLSQLAGQEYSDCSIPFITAIMKRRRTSSRPSRRCSIAPCTWRTSRCRRASIISSMSFTTYSCARSLWTSSSSNGTATA